VRTEKNFGEREIEEFGEQSLFAGYPASGKVIRKVIVKADASRSHNTSVLNTSVEIANNLICSIDPSKES